MQESIQRWLGGGAMGADDVAAARVGRGRDPRRWLRDRVPASVRRADRTAYAAVARTRIPVLGAVLPRLSTAADRSRLWLVVAGLLALAGGRQGRRAAVHGVVAIATTSALTNVPAKLLAGRPRPGLEVVPTVRRLTRTPTSPSFPSGHTASAFAFATAVGRDLPRSRAPLFALATLVGFSRVYTGAHYPGDVLAGAAVGVAVGRATAAPWGGEDPAPAMARVVTAPPPIGEDGQGLVVVANAGAGSEVEDEVLDLMQRRLPQMRVVMAEEGEDLPGTLRRAASDAWVLGVAGGDGSASAAARVAADRGLPLLVIPTGTLNHLARDLGIDDVEAALAAAIAGQVVEMDLAVFGDRSYVNVASIGWYPHLVDARERFEDRIGKWPALAWCTIQEALRGRPLACELDGHPRRVWSVTIGNGRFDEGGLVPTRRRRLDEGCLEVQIVDADLPWSRLRLLAAIATGRLERSRVFRRRVLSQMEVIADHPLRLARDGETADGPARLSAQIRPGALQVVQPRPDLG